MGAMKDSSLAPFMNSVSKEKIKPNVKKNKPNIIVEKIKIVLCVFNILKNDKFYFDFWIFGAMIVF